MSENNNNSSSSSAAQPKQSSLRLRSRFPKAQPNIALSSGINRIRRLSGHYNENEKPEHEASVGSEKSDLTHRTRKNSIKLTNADLNTTESAAVAVVIETAVIEEKTASIVVTSEKQEAVVTTQIESSVDNSSCSLATQAAQLLNELQHNNYNPRFSKEHIMNIIKFKAMQKLKKIESDSLKEKRRSYKPTIDTENVDRSKLRMRDLLYYNSKNRAKKSSADNSLIDENSNMTSASDRLSSVASPMPAPVAVPVVETAPQSTTTEPSAPSYNAPQLKFAEDGSIVLNEESLVVQRPIIEPVFDSTVIENDRNDNLTYNSYRKFHHTKKWSNKETVKFYKALSMIGTDFTMIQRLFPYRNRDEIKRKFKREEKINQALIDKILSKTAPMDLSVFVQNSDTDHETEADTAVNDDNSSNSNDTSVTTNSNSNENDTNNNKTKKPYNRYKPKRTKKRAFIESDDEQPNENTITKATTVSSEVVTTTTTTSVNKGKQMKDNNSNTGVFINASRNLMDTINTVISRVNEITATAATITSTSSSDTSVRGEEKKVVETVEEVKKAIEEKDYDSDDIEVVLDLDNDYCEIVENNKNTTKTTINEPRQQEFRREASATRSISCGDEEIVILDLDSNQTIIKKSRKESSNNNNNNNNNREQCKVTSSLTPTKNLTTSSSLIASSSSTLLASPVTVSPFNNNNHNNNSSKLIFVNSASAADNKQFQVHMFTPEQQHQQQVQVLPRVSNSEIIITKISTNNKTKK